MDGSSDLFGADSVSLRKVFNLVALAVSFSLVAVLSQQAPMDFPLIAQTTAQENTVLLDGDREVEVLGLSPRVDILSGSHVAIYISTQSWAFDPWRGSPKTRRKETTYSLEPVGQKNQPGPPTILYGLALAFALITGAVIGSLFDEQGKRQGDIFKKQFKSKIGVALLSVGCASGVFFAPTVSAEKVGFENKPLPASVKAAYPATQRQGRMLAEFQLNGGRSALAWVTDTNPLKPGQMVTLYANDL